MGGRVRVNHRSGRSQVVAYCPDQLLWGDPKESPARQVVDLSHSEGASINEGIEPELCNMRYTSVVC